MAELCSESRLQSIQGSGISMPDRVADFLISTATLKDLKLICVALSKIKYNTLGVFLVSHRILQ